jgi:hypothetical protein
MQNKQTDLEQTWTFISAHLERRVQTLAYLWEAHACTGVVMVVVVIMVVKVAVVCAVCGVCVCVWGGGGGGAWV